MEWQDIETAPKDGTAVLVVPPPTDEQIALNKACKEAFQGFQPNWLAANPLANVPYGYRDNGDGRWVYDPVK